MGVSLLPSQTFSVKGIMNNFNLKKFGGKGDLDFDGVPNWKDCQPRNPIRQHWFSKKSKNNNALSWDEYTHLLKLKNKPKHSYETYGKTTSISGNKLGTGVALSGAAVPVVLPLPLTMAAGKLIKDKVDKVTFVKTNSQDRPYRIPRVEFHLKDKKRLNIDESLEPQFQQGGVSEEAEPTYSGNNADNYVKEAWYNERMRQANAEAPQETEGGDDEGDIEYREDEPETEEEEV